MNELNSHYGLFLGRNDSGEAIDVNFDPEGGLVEFLLGHRGGKLSCPECQGACTQADLATEFFWRHLDLIQFETRIRERVPRRDFQRFKNLGSPFGRKPLAVHSAVRGVCGKGGSSRF